MPLNLSLAQNFKVVQAIAPATDGSGLDGDYVSLKNCHKCFVLVNLAQGHAATTAFTIEKATDVAGTGSTAITNAVPIWVNSDVATSDTLVRQTDAVSYTTSATLKNKVILFEVKPESLGEGYDCIIVKAGSSNASNLISASYILVGERYAQATPPAAITD